MEECHGVVHDSLKPTESHLALYSRLANRLPEQWRSRSYFTSISVVTVALWRLEVG